MEFVIKTVKGYVAGFNGSHGLVSCCTEEHKEGYAKRFKTEKQAQKFIDKYADLGYGLAAEGTTIEKFQ